MMTSASFLWGKVVECEQLEVVHSPHSAGKSVGSSAPFFSLWQRDARDRRDWQYFSRYPRTQTSNTQSSIQTSTALNHKMAEAPVFSVERFLVRASRSQFILPLIANIYSKSVAAWAHAHIVAMNVLDAANFVRLHL
jgi:hypothetical protein